MRTLCPSRGRPHTHALDRAVHRTDHIVLSSSAPQPKPQTLGPRFNVHFLWRLRHLLSWRCVEGCLLGLLHSVDGGLRCFKMSGIITHQNVTSSKTWIFRLTVLKASNFAPVCFSDRFPVGSNASRNCKMFKVYNCYVITIGRATASR